MYLPGVHVEQHLPTLRQLIRDNPLGILTTAIPSTSAPLIQSSHIPWVLKVEDDESETELGVLRGHMARVNPQSKAMIESVQNDPNASEGSVLEQDVLVLFTSQVHHYVTPKFYVQTKPKNGKVVPTWNYAAVQAYGRARIFYDTKAEKTSSFLSSQIDELSNLGEREIMRDESPWEVTDAPDKYIEVMKKAIIGIEIEITRLEGKFKMSQEMSIGDREGVIAGFQSIKNETASKVAQLVESRGALKDQKKRIQS